MIVIAESTDKVRQVFLDRKIGVTVLKGEGGYSSEVQRVVMCVSEKEGMRAFAEADPQSG